MKSKSLHIIVAVAIILCCSKVSAKENVGVMPKKAHANASLFAACTPAKAQTDLGINNVRITILAGGDMWWDLNTARYEIPKGGKAHSLFAGALWIGGFDLGGNLKLAAMTYRQSGNDFWPGPLDTAKVSIDKLDCDAFDKHFKITRKEVEDFNAGLISPTQGILNWPANGNPATGQARFLAPFYDNNGDGFYDPYAGDYPGYDLRGNLGCNNVLFGDQTLWWVFNDKGNIHGETGGDPIGLEIHAQAFGFKTTDEINDMTFYNYKIINRSSFTMDSTFFGQWVDPDLGFFSDDYVGCDVSRGLGYCYNGNAVDGTGAPGQYGTNPPAIGMDFFQGPIADPGDGIDNDRDGTIDETGEQIIMSKFVYYDNDFSVKGNPETATHFYGYLSGSWKDGTRFTYGGNAYGGTTICDFMFPGDSDPTGWGTAGVPQTPWDEASSGNTPADRRFLQSAGPFTLKPGAVNYITTGAVWARATQGGPQASVNLLKAADTKAQALFNSCFKILNGPDAPKLTIQELDKEVIIYMEQFPNSNNANEAYQERDPYVTTGPDTLYKFEGYQVYQLKDEFVNVTELNNPDKARMVMQCDIKNGTGQIINYYLDYGLSAWVPKEEVAGADNGLIHSFNIKDDLFAIGDKRLVNHKSYYYMVVAYGFNPGEVNKNPYATNLKGYNLPYIKGRKNVQVYTAIPHIPSPESGGTEQNAKYGDGPKFTRIEGQGNGGNVLDLTPGTIEEILQSPTHRVLNPQYEKSRGPVKIKVIDPLSVVNGDFEFRLTGVADTSGWELLNKTTGEVVKSSQSIKVNTEQIIPLWGLSVTIDRGFDPGPTQVPIPSTGANIPPKNGFLEASMTFSDVSKMWLTGLPDLDGDYPMNWIRSGKYYSVANPEFNDYDVSSLSAKTSWDPNEEYEKILNRTWAPYRLCARSSGLAQAGPQFSTSSIFLPNLSDLASVDVVMTSDKSKWTRCPVLEMHENPGNVGGVKKFDVRNAPSVDKEGQSASTGGNVNDADYISARGMGWFPGYAINVETGERLNMAFGEDSYYTTENGNDMLWNPTSNMFFFNGVNAEPLFGAKHYIYIFAHTADSTAGKPRMPRYDAGAFMRRILAHSSVSPYVGPSDIQKRLIFQDAMWVNIPLLAQGRKILETDVKVRLRVSKSYKKCYATTLGTDCAPSPVNNNFPLYTFNTADLQANKNDADAAKAALDLINVVPNPYYGQSAYEKDQLENKIRITYLPEKCSISIYTLNGTLIRQFRKDDPKTWLDWDLKNKAGIPIGSGLYIIYIDVPGVGEKILKWFGVMRPIDLDNF